MKLEPALPSRDLTDGRLKVVVFTSGPLIPVNSVFLERLSKDPLLDLRGIIVDEYRRPRKNLAQRVLKSLREERLPWLAFKLRSRLEALVERLALRFFEALHPRVSPQESYEAFEKSTGVPVYRVADIHSEQSLKLIRSLAPQLGVILGGRILRDTVISIPEKNAKQIVWLRLGRLCTTNPKILCWQERIFLREIFALFASSRLIPDRAFTAKTRRTQKNAKQIVLLRLDRLCTTNLKILCWQERIFLREIFALFASSRLIPDSAFTTKTRRTQKNAKQIVWLRLGRLCVHPWFRSFFWFATSARRGIRGATNYHELNSSQLPIARAGSGKLCGELVLAHSFPLTLLSRFMHMTRSSGRAAPVFGMTHCE